MLSLALSDAAFAADALEKRVAAEQMRIDETINGLRASESALSRCVAEKEEAARNKEATTTATPPPPAHRPWRRESAGADTGPRESWSCRIVGVCDKRLTSGEREITTEGHGEPRRQHGGDRKEEPRILAD